MAEKSRLTKGFGQNVAEIRRRKGMTQQQVATKIDVSLAYVGLIETGKRWPSARVIEQLSKVLDTSISQLFRDIN